MTGTSKTPEEKDSVNWFGVKIGTEPPKLGFEGETGGSVIGKYISLKRPQEAVVPRVADDTKKKRKIGFGDFEGW